MKLRNVCVYCGSSEGHNPVFAEAGDRFGRILARSGIGLVYGGGSIGIMGTVARAVLAEGGRVTGVIPEFLCKFEIPLHEVTELIVTESMHERKQLMFEKSDAFVALPGGIGTLEETVEMLTWAQLGRHRYPIVLVNIDGFWDPLIDLFDHMISEGFAKQNVRQIYHVVDRVDAVLDSIEAVL